MNNRSSGLQTKSPGSLTGLPGDVTHVMPSSDERNALPPSGEDSAPKMRSSGLHTTRPYDPAGSVATLVHDEPFLEVATMPESRAIATKSLSSGDQHMVCHVVELMVPGVNPVHVVPSGDVIEVM